MSLLDSMMAMASSRANQTLASRLASSAAKCINNMSRSHMELELRCGQASPTGAFVSGVDSVDFEYILEHAKSANGAVEMSDTTNYLYGNGSTIVVVDNRTQKIIASRVKLASGRQLIVDAVSDIGYSIRIAVSTEKPAAIPTTLPPQWTNVRRKLRTSITFADWRLDLTKVIDANDRITYEIEMEVLPDSIPADNEASKILDIIFSQALLFITTAIQFRRADTLMVTQVFKNILRTSIPMPITLSRKNLPELRDYLVCAKHDGERCILIILDDGAFSLDREQRVRRISATSWCKLGTKTILDCERIGDKYIIFDAVVIEDDHVGTQPLTHRLSAIESLLERVVDTPLDTKPFYAASDIRALFSEIATTETPTDGLIFTHNASPYGARPIFKWKSSNMLSVDMEKQGTMLGVRGDGNIFIGVVPVADVEGIVRDAIVETIYDVSSGTWKVIRQRPDRINSNHIRTLLSTLTTLAENVTQQDLSSVI